jgi:hypothetical protein
MEINSNSESSEVIEFVEEGVHKTATYLRHEDFVVFDPRKDWLLIAEPQGTIRSRQTPRWVWLGDIDILEIRVEKEQCNA